MNTIDTIRERFDTLQSGRKAGKLRLIEQQAFQEFSAMGIPTTRNEEWKYTRIGSLFNEGLQLPGDIMLSREHLDAHRLPGWEKASELVFINGIYNASLSVIRSSGIVVLPLEEAGEAGYADIVSTHLGCSGRYIKDGIHALNTAFLHQGVFLHIKKAGAEENPVYIYHVTGQGHVLAQPRSLIYVEERAQVQFTETHISLGEAPSLTNQVTEVVVEKDAAVWYYKIQNDAQQASQVNTTHFRQVGKSFVHTVTVSLNGGIVRNNLNISLEAEHCEAHLYGLYFMKGEGHVDNHTLVSHVKPNCMSNELYKGIADGHSAAVFNGKIFVHQQAQKTNAFQSNKNILLSESASVNTKPQLEIFADDVKCSHGCTVGQLDMEGLFYLRSRGIDEKVARALLVQAFAGDILERIGQGPIRQYVEALVAEQLEF
ncbi:MAG TPA: Fe-S cluster assembly protein SufD [Flavisolibacter sp.]|nr:Fe-S cluster assembly protein SufD [Flavisolibacter sp.]